MKISTLDPLPATYYASQSCSSNKIPIGQSYVHKQHAQDIPFAEKQYLEGVRPGLRVVLLKKLRVSRLCVLSGCATSLLSC